MPSPNWFVNSLSFSFFICNKVSVFGDVANVSFSSIISIRNAGSSPTPVSSSLIDNPSCSSCGTFMSYLAIGTAHTVLLEIFKFLKTKPFGLIFSKI